FIDERSVRNRSNSHAVVQSNKKFDGIFCELRGKVIITDFFNQQQPIININANPTINTNIPNSIYIPANPMGSNSFQYGVATPPMQQANQPNNYNSYPQQMFMPNNEHIENLRSMFK
ncbi:unnamed protein product, partial [Rotaria magnacalcarata]